METILEIQSLEQKIKQLNREVSKCQASVDYENYKKFLQDGKAKFEQLEAQSAEIIKSYNRALNQFTKLRGESEIVRKKNSSNLNIENASSLVNEANGLVGDLSEESRRIDDLVRKSEEIVRRSAELSVKLMEAKKISGSIKLKIEAKKEEVAPKIAQINEQIKALEPKVKDKEAFKKYKELREKGLFPVYVKLMGNSCGGCTYELSLNFIEKLKTNKMLTCEHCGRIIMLK